MSPDINWWSGFFIWWIMENFEVINPTRILFGKNQLFRLPELLRSFEVQKIMIVYGGGSVKQLGLLDKLLNELKGFDVFEFGGVEANPEYATLMDGVALAQKHEIDFFLAVGGGSVIDGVKFMSGALFYEGEPWDVLPSEAEKLIVLRRETGGSWLRP